MSQIVEWTFSTSSIWTVDVYWSTKCLWWSAL